MLQNARTFSIIFCFALSLMWNIITVFYSTFFILKRKSNTVTYRKKNDRNGEGDGHQHCQPDQEHQDVQGVHLAVGVQQLGFHGAYKPEGNV